MGQTFKFKDGKFTESSSDEASVLFFHSLSSEDKQEYVDRFNLPSDVFDQNLIHHYKDKFDSIESVLVYAGILMYSNLYAELQQQKATIDELNEIAKSSSSGDTLRKVADTERNLVFLEHNIETLDETVTNLLDSDLFTSRLNNSALEYDLKWYNRQVIKLVHVYRDLLDSVSSLFSDLVSDNLNKIMKFLNSLSLVLASSSLVSGFWGINTGGLPGENSDYGTIMVLILVLISTGSMTLFLKKKDYF
ncbi:MAG TPA: hypothetical protein K8U70_02690 [Facklamia tabacinasalis]|nr:hypothetical protein [Ruoffia tabacinasalis]